jgi:hypothetical protein
VLDADALRHILEEHEEMASHGEAILRTVAKPEHRAVD